MGNKYINFESNIKECYKRMNLVSLDTKRYLNHELRAMDWEDFEVAVQMVQEYVFHTISDEDKTMFSDELRHYLYNSKLQKNVAYFSLVSPDSLRFLSKYYGGEQAKVPAHAVIYLSDIMKIGMDIEFSLGESLGVDLAYGEDDYAIDNCYAITSSLKSLIHNCNPLRLQYTMSYCGRFVRLVRLYEDYFSNLAKETESVTAILLSVAAYWVRRNISYELNDMNVLINSIVYSDEYSSDGRSFQDSVKLEMIKFDDHHDTPTSADIKAEIIDWIK